MEDQRQLVDVGGVGGVDDRPGFDVAQVGDLDLEIVGDGFRAATDDEIGLDAPTAQLGDGVLGGLRLLFAGRADERHERDVDVAHVVAPGLVAELPHRLEERQDLDVPDGSADFGDHDVDVVGRQAADPALDLVGDVGDDLDGLAEVVASALGGEDGLVDRACRGVGVAGQVLVDEALVVAEIEVGLAAVVGDEDLAVLERVHRARIDVDVRIELLERDAQTAQLEQATERGGREALAEGAGHPARHEDVLRHWGDPPIVAAPTSGSQRTARRTGETGTVPVGEPRHGPSAFGRWVFERDGNAVASVLLGVAGLLAFGLILGPIAIGLGILAKRRIRLSGLPGDTLATAGIAIGAVAMLIPVVLYIT